MSKKATEFQRKVMSKTYRGKGIFVIDSGFQSFRITEFTSAVSQDVFESLLKMKGSHSSL